MPWTTLTGSADTLADSHAALATKIEVDVERPLREFTSTNRESQAMTTIQGNLSAMAKDVAKAHDKADKLQGRGTRAEAGKVASASSELDTAQSQWESQAPYVFESLQALDETRLNHLRDVLTQFQTHEVDQVERSRTTAEHCLNVLLSVETADEIKTFALKAVSHKPSLARPQRGSTLGLPGAAPTPSRAPPPSSVLTPSISQPDDESQRSASVQEEKKGRLKGLKRLGTVMGRKRESKQPSTLAPMAESPERKPRPSPFSALRRGRSKDAQSLEPPQEAAERHRPNMPAPYGSEVFQPPPSSREAPASPTPAQRSVGAPQINGIASTAPVLAASIPNGSHQSDLTDLEPPKPSQPMQRDLEPQAPAAATAKDEEGFSLPPQNLDPISRAQQEAADAAGEGSASAFNVNIRNAPIQDEGTDPHAALASLTNTLVSKHKATEHLRSIDYR